MKPVTKSVIPAAGLGTRFLPATKAIPKELLPVVDTPAIHYVVAEAAAAGLDDVLLVTARGKGAIENYFDEVPELQASLEAKGDEAKLRAVLESAGLATIHSVRQDAPRGLGHAVLCAARHVGDSPFAVQLGDDIIDERDPILPAMIKVQAELGGSVIALMEVDPRHVSMYGCAATAGTKQVAGVTEDVHQIEALVEKPDPADAPSNLAVIGRYVLDPAVFEVLRRTKPGRGGEIQLTDALAELASTPTAEGGGVHGVVFRGRRYDTGDKLDYLKAVVQLASERDDLGPDFLEWLREFITRD